MASITNENLDIMVNAKTKKATCKVTCNIKFSDLEVCMMKACKGQWFKLRCQLWGADDFLRGEDDLLHTFQTILYFPDNNPSTSEPVLFEETVNHGVLDEDDGRDEVYAKLILKNLTNGVKISKKTDEIKYHF